MSQIYKLMTSGNLPGNVLEQVTADDATTAVPSAHNLNLFSTESSVNNVNGIQSTASGSTLTYVLTNRIAGTVQTVGLVTANVLTFTTPNIAGIYALEVSIAAYDSAHTQGAAYTINGTIRADGLGGLTTVGSPTRTVDGDVEFNVTQVTVTFSGLNILAQVTGLTGDTIRWTALMTYVFGGA